MSGSESPYTNSEKAGDLESHPPHVVPTAGQQVWMPPFGGAFQPAPYKPSFRKFGNPAPLGLCAFALTTFILSLINANTRGVSSPSIVVGSAYAYGGLIQLLAGMWEMAVGSEYFLSSSYLGQSALNYMT